MSNIDSINKAVLDLMNKEGGAKIFAEKLDNIVTPQYFSNMKGKRTQEPSARLILKIMEKFGPGVFIEKERNVTYEYVSIREDVWKEIEVSNTYYRAENTSFRNQIEKNSSKLIDIIDHLIQGGNTVPKQT